MAPPPPPLPIEIVEEILVRFPPDDPAHLVRAALVCKPWARHVASAGFRRRYRQRHRDRDPDPPVLGLVANLADTGGAARFVPTRCAFRPALADRRGYRAQDAHHGRVLLSRIRAPPSPWPQSPEEQESALAVWDPIAGEQRNLPLLPRPRLARSWNAAVLCAGAADDDCDHLDCHRGPFRVVFVGIDDEEMFAHVYSSATGAWTEDARTADLPPVGAGDDQLDAGSPGGVLAAAGGALYFLLQNGDRVLRCNPETREMTILCLPSMVSGYAQRIALMAVEDAELGFAHVDMDCVLRIWSLKIISPEQGLWTISRAVDLKTMPAMHLQTQIPPRARTLRLRLSPICAVAAVAARGAGVVFLKTNDGLYSFDLSSGQAVKVSMSSCFFDIIPYMSFYTPVLRVALRDEGPCAIW